MRHRTRRLLAISAALGLVASGGAAYAAGGSHAGAPSGGRGGILTAVTSYLGVSAKQLRVDLAAGKTLAQVATAHGKSVGGLEQAIGSAAKSRLDQAVTAGKITAAQEQKLLGALQSRLDSFVDRAHPFIAVRHAARARGLVASVAGYLGVTAQQLKTELVAGKSLAQVATEHGKTVAGLEQAITAAVKSRLDRAVAAGLISTQTERTILARLGSHLGQILDHSFTH
jgi:hypothetical protein